MAGDTVSHYRLLEPLGGGGTGVVYKAEDLRLGRFVALKFLTGSAGLSGEGGEEARRFLREARAAAAIEHPNLCTVYEIDETDAADGSQLFLAMAFYEGETLEARIERGPLDLASAVDLAFQIASGLCKAHELGIIHRDIKPGNVLVTAGGQAKILDFGIAQLTGQTRLTRAGSMVGTAAYLSPEALRGEPVDPRMDVWSLGVVLYEMVTGRRPFQGEDKVLMYSILHLNPPPMSAARPEVPAELDRIAARALARKAAGRYPGLAEMLSDLSALRASSFPRSAGGEMPAEASLTPSPVRDGDRTGAAQRPEPVWTGRVLGRYRVLRRLAGGGMGVVYEAEDMRLGRKVAIKLLPPHLLDPEGKERFLREAQTASAMDHPNLCTVYDVGETEDDQLYLAMPLYDGGTLRQRLESGPLPVAEAVDVARQISQGLARVHRQGIVHRDIKPANLMVTADGIVKILDFGISKPAGEAQALSQEGASAGTPAYRSPEQSSRGAVDARTDLWSLGVVLYEMLVGRRPFRGEPEQAVVYAVLHEEPEPLSRARPEVAPELERIVGRLLAKDPERRYPAAEEVAADLRALSGEASGARPVPAGHRPGAWRWPAVAALATIAILLLIAVGLTLRGPGPAPPKLPPATYVQITEQPGMETSPSLSPDGEVVAYAKEVDGDFDLCLQVVGSNAVTNLTADSSVDDYQPAFSPDGQWIAFHSDRAGGGLFVMDLSGKRVRPLTPGGYNPSWSPDGRQIAYATEGVFDPRVRMSTSQLWRVEVETGKRHQLLTGDAVQPSWSPDGGRIAYWGTVNTRRVLWTIPVAGGPAVPAVDDDKVNWSPVWSRDGKHLLFASDRRGSMNLWQVRIDERSGQVEGEPEPLSTPSQSSSLPSLSADGRRIAYAKDDSRISLDRVAFDPVRVRTGESIIPVLQGTRSIRSAQLSPDGQWIVFDISGPQEDLFLANLKGEVVRRLTDDLSRDRSPQWSPDGSRILFYSNLSGNYEAWTIRPDGGGRERLTALGQTLFNPVWSPDQKRLVANLGYSGAVLFDLTVPIERRRPIPLPRLPDEGPDRFFAVASWSPDGKWLAGAGRLGAAVYSFESSRQTNLNRPCLDPSWLPDNRTLLCHDGNRIAAVDVRTGKSRIVLEQRPPSHIFRMSVSADRREIYFVRGTEEGDIWMSKLE